MFYYDQDCGFCQWSAEKLVRLATVEVAPAPLGEHAVYEVPDRVGDPKSPGVAGQQFLGHEAIGQALARHGRWAPVRWVGRVLLFRLLRPLFAGVYRLVAHNRHRLGPLVGRQACTVRPAGADSESNPASPNPACHDPVSDNPASDNPAVRFGSDPGFLHRDQNSS